jgi:hypothetical protein
VIQGTDPRGRGGPHPDVKGIERCLPPSPLLPLILIPVSDRHIPVSEEKEGKNGIFPFMTVKPVSSSWT